jgi:hypothetical protein
MDGAARTIPIVVVWSCKASACRLSACWLSLRIRLQLPPCAIMNAAAARSLVTPA